MIREESLPYFTTFSHSHKEKNKYIKIKRNKECIEIDTSIYRNNVKLSIAFSNYSVEENNYNISVCCKK